MTEISKEESKYIDRVRDDFYLTFGYYPDITLNKPENIETKINLPLLQIKNKVQDFNKKYRIDSASRLQELVFLRKIYCMVATDYKHTCTSIGRSLNRDHSTVLHNVKSGYNLLETDNEFRELYIKVTKTIDPKVYPHARINEVSEEQKNNSRSGNDSKLYARKYHVSRPGFQSRSESDIFTRYKNDIRTKDSDRQSTSDIRGVL